MISESWGKRSRSPDLLDSLSAVSRDRKWVTEAAEAIADLNGRGSKIVLIWCEWEKDRGDYLAIVGFDRRLVEAVRRGDEVSAGFAAIREASREVQIFPRIYRKVCANGVVVLRRSDEDALATERSVADAIGSCFEKKPLEEVVAAMKSAARTPVDDPGALLAQARAASSTREVVRAFDRGGDRTVWGLVNAATALARREPDLRRRLHLERDAERILRAAGLLAPGGPLQRGAGSKIPACSAP
jgi:hypothetical protein